MNSHWQELFMQPDGIYALSHSVGPLSKATATVLSTEYLQTWAEHGGDAWPHWLQQIDKFCSSIAYLIGADEHEICPQNNVAAGFSSFLNAIAKLPAYTHKRVILMHEDAFPSMGFVVAALSAQYHLELKLVRGHPNDVSVWQNHLQQNNVLACLITHVHSNTSLLSNAQQLCRMIKHYDAFALVDVAQSVGIVQVAVKDWQADAIFGSCVKWLCGGPGAGFMYVSHSIVEQLQPDLQAWFSHENPFEFDIHHYKSHRSAKRFWGGTPSIAPYVAANAALEQLSDMGWINIRKHNHSLKQALYKSIYNKVLALPYQSDIQELGGSLCIQVDNLPALIQHLHSNNVRFDTRDTIIRLSLHVNNTYKDIETIADCF